jgi:UDP-glucose 4-epimerase
MKRVVVFGARGFIGTRVASAIDVLDGYEVVRISRYPGNGHSTADLTAPDSLTAVIGRDDIVINCAGYAGATDVTPAGQSRFEAVNVKGVAALAEACVARSACQLIHLSSVAAMGAWSGQNVDEQMLRNPSTPYALSKLRSERILERFRDRLFVTVLRPTSVFGEGRGLARTLCRLVSLPLVPLPGAGRAEIPFTYVGNVVDGVVLTLQNPACYGQAFIIGDERSYSLREIVRALSQALEKHPLLLTVPTALARAAALLLERGAALRNSTPLIDSHRINALTQSVSYSISKFKAATGYRPTYDLQRAANRIADWYLRGLAS